MFHLLLAIIYISFISLGLPDSLLGSAWPTMYQQFSVPVSYAGIISMIISVGTIISSLQSDRLTRKLGTGKVTAISVGMTAVALFGFSASGSFPALCVWAIPYGLGAGSVDASLNNYVALHYASRHMSWLHCMWGVGAAAGPYIMSFALFSGGTWNTGYRYISIIQFALTAILLISLPLWKGRNEAIMTQENTGRDTLPVSEAAEKTSSETSAVTSRKNAFSERNYGYTGRQTNYGRFFLLQRSGNDRRALGQQLSGTAPWDRYADCRQLCQPVLYRYHRRPGCQRVFNHEIFRYTNDPYGAKYHSTGHCGSLHPCRKRPDPGRTDPDRIGVRACLSLHHSFHPPTFRGRQIPGNHRRTDGLRLHRKLSHASSVWIDCQPSQRSFVSGLFRSGAASDVCYVSETAENQSIIHCFSQLSNGDSETMPEVCIHNSKCICSAQAIVKCTILRKQ